MTNPFDIDYQLKKEAKKKAHNKMVYDNKKKPNVPTKEETIARKKKHYDIMCKIHRTKPLIR